MMYPLQASISNQPGGMHNTRTRTVKHLLEVLEDPVSVQSVTG